MMAQQVMKIPVIANLTKDTVAIHLVSSLRAHVFPELQKLNTAVNNTNDYHQIKLEVASSYLSNLGFAIDRLKKKWRQMNPKKYSTYKVNVTR